MPKEESPWIDRDGPRKPDDGQQVLADLQGADRADDEYTVTRYVAEKDLFVGEGYTRKVVRWMPIPKPGRRKRVNWEKWRDTYGERRK